MSDSPRVELCSQHATTGATAATTLPRLGRLGVVLMLLGLCAAAPLAAGQADAVTRARALAEARQRGAAIELLEAHLAGSPNDGDARVLLATVLSWEGRYDRARQQLDVILTESPTHGDALPAMINVELWSSHFDRAEQLTAQALRSRPNDTGMLLARARALIALQRPSEARDTLDRLLVIDPGNEQAHQMRRGLQASLRPWHVRVRTSYDAFSDRRVAWREWQVGIGRTAPMGSILLRASRAERFGLQDEQIELEAYPRFRAGTYAALAVAYSPDAILYPAYRYAVDLHQRLGAGFEASAGLRRLAFERSVNVYVASLSKYHGQWLFSGRAFVTPSSEGSSRSYEGSFRRYVGDAGTFVGLRYGQGGWREELRDRRALEVIDSKVGSADATFVIGGRFELNLTGAYTREDRVEQRNVRQYAISTGVGVRF